MYNLLWALLAAQDPLPPLEAARGMSVPPGFRVSLFAGEPDVRQPIAFAMDDRGRLWVAENYAYPSWAPGPGKDRILIFEDVDNDGAFDRRSVFVEGLNFISGVELGFGGVWVTAPPYLLFYPTRPGGDLPAGPPEIRLDGWEHQDTHNLVNNLSWGPDGWLYGCQGIATKSRVGAPGTPDAARVYMDTGIWRYHPLTRRFEVFSEGGSNPWGVDFDDRGQALVVQCVIPHLHRMLQGGRHMRLYGRHPAPYTYGDLQHIADHLHWIGHTPHAGNGKSDAVGGGHAHAGVMVYLGDSFPPEYRDRVYANNIHGRRVVTDILERRGSGYLGRHGPDFLQARDPAYRGLNLAYGPDGSVFILDWTDQTACHFFGPEAYDRRNGRIFKVAYGERRPPTPDLSARSSAELVRLQLHANDWHVRHARRLLQERGPDPAVHAALAEILRGHADEPRRLRALWALHATGGLTDALARRALDDGSEWVRAWTVQLLGEDGRVFSETRDPSPVVRLYQAALLQRLPPARRWTLAAALLADGEDATDPALPLMLWYGVEPLDALDGERALALVAASKFPLLREFMARRHAETRQDFSVLARRVAATEEVGARRDFLRGFRDGLNGRAGLRKPEGWATLATALADPELRAVARDIGAVFGDAAALESLRRVAADGGAALGERTKALQTLVGVRDAGLAPLLRELLKEPALRGASIRALGGTEDAANARAILEIYPALNVAERRDALNALAGRPAWARDLLEALRLGRLPKSDFTAAVIRQLSEHPEVAEEVAKEWGAARPTSDERRLEIDQTRRDLQKGPPGNPTRGREIFAKTCAQCHVLFGEGGKVGPELTGGQRSDLDYLLVNIMDPSAVVGRDYTATTVRTKGGRVLTGLVKAETADTLTLATENDAVTLAKSDVDARRQSELSMMPEGLMGRLSARERADLIAYLRSPSQVPLPKR
ncbi:MAG TPA: PVC-type heme-binding CxxCH protein [Planctomycetota bacterium]